MTRTDFLKRLALLAAAPIVLPACRYADEGEAALTPGAGAAFATAADTLQFGRLQKSRAEWRRLLPADAYRVLFEEATEPPFSSPLNAEKRPGTFLCAACFLPLFDAATKYESGTGWPSFYAPIAGRMGQKADRALGMLRTEYHCARCGGHQGHVFDDGPPPTGQRWCNNGVALRFVPQGQPLPALRT